MHTRRAIKPISTSSRREPIEEKLFNELNIYHRECCTFVAKSEYEQDMCGCNRPKEKYQQHHERRRDGSNAYPRTLEKLNLEHKNDNRKEVVKWNMESHSVRQTSRAYGSLPNGAKFVRLALDTPVEITERILLNIWKLEEPQLVVSVIGGAKYFALSERLETNFINGLIDVALKSNAWLITNGSNVGIVQLVGQAINKVKLTEPGKHVTAIAVCKWGSIKGVEKLTNNKDGNNATATTDQDNDGGKERKRIKGERDLEMNHSHYLMMDDGTILNYDTRDYRTKLCVKVTKLQHENAVPIPVVTIVVEGGKDTVTNMYHDLRDDIPVVIIDGSGRVANFFKRWLLVTKEMDTDTKHSETPYNVDVVDIIRPENGNEVIEISSKPNGRTQLQRELDNSKNTLKGIFKDYSVQMNKELEEILTHDDDSRKKNEVEQSPGSSNDPQQKFSPVLLQAMYCLQPAVRSSIEVFNLNSDNKLSETIFRSICKSRQRYFKRKQNEEATVDTRKQRREKPQPSSQTKERHSVARDDVNQKDRSAQRSKLLQLAMDWDCIDAAKELIIQNSIDNILNKDEAFIDALTKNLPTFVYEFLKLGIDPTKTFFPGDAFSKGDVRYKKFLTSLYKDKEEVNDLKITQLSSFIEGDPGTGKTIRFVNDLNRVLKNLIGDYMHELYFRCNDDEVDYQIRCGLKERDSYYEDRKRDTTKRRRVVPAEEDKEMSRDYIMRDLFLWSILMNYVDMAKVLLSHMKYRICPALIATKILKQYYTIATHGDIKKTYLKSAEYFEKYAMECVNKCEKHDPDKGCQIILQQIPLYGNVTCLQVAADAKDKLFIASSCCVQSMNSIWYDKVHPQQTEKTADVAMTAGVFSLGLLAPVVVRYRQEEAQKDEPLDKSFASHGITYSDPYALEYPRYVKNLPINQYIHRMANFHQSLRMKYCYHCISYCFFLLLFSYVLLFQFQRPTSRIPSIDWTEILTIILVSCMLIEEIHYFVSLDSLTFTGKFTSYFRNLFKMMTLVGFVLFYIGLVLRFRYANTEDDFTAARVVMAFDLEIWWLRSLTFIIVVPFLGPHLVAIGLMLKDLLFFMCIIFLVMTGYGVASRSMAYYPNADKFVGTNISTAFDGRTIFRQIAYPVYYFMYGNIGTELANLDEYPDAGWSISTHVLLAIHMIFVNILLTNLLIAMFSKRFDQVYDDTTNIWYSQQYIFTREYFTRAPFFPPISLFYDLYYLCRKTVYAIKRTWFNGTSDRKARVFKIIPISNHITKEWYQFEGASTYEYAHAEVKAAKDAATKAKSESDSKGTEKKEDGSDEANASKKEDLKEIQDMFTKLTTTLEEIKGKLNVETSKKKIEPLKE